MTPLEELRAAHGRLSELREGGPTWALNGRGEVVSGIYMVAETTDDQYAKLIVTLHRTIDAQLAVLGDGITWESWRLGHVDYTGPSEHVMTLARAINGEAS